MDKNIQPDPSKKIIIVFFIILIAGIVAMFYWQTLSKSVPAEPLPVVCPADAKQCPDGSYVSRTGLHCEFKCPRVEPSPLPTPLPKPKPSPTPTPTPTPTPVPIPVPTPVFDFSLSNGGAKTVIQGQSVQNTITATLVSGLTQPVSFVMSGLPQGASVNFSRISCSPTCESALTITTTATTAAGNYPITVRGISIITKTTQFNLTVTALPILPATTINQNYQSSNDIFPNPERGFFSWTDFNYPSYAHVRAAGNTLSRPYFRLDPYINSPIPQTFLNQISVSFDRARAAGIKIIPRFSYNFAIGPADATKEQILSHIAQVAPILEANVDVISSMEASFIGSWGEWHHSTTGADSPESKAEILNAILAALPENRMVALRYPADIRNLQRGPITRGEAYSRTNRARIGSHQDCFLASNDDWGTWGLRHDFETQSWLQGEYTVEQDKNYIAENGLYSVVGGETCNYNPPRSNCPVALAELERMHWSYLNMEYEPTVIAGFRSQGCFDEINRRLGYRYELITSSYQSGVTRGSDLDLQINLRNVGYAAMFNERPVFAVLENSTNKYTFELSADPRRWEAGETSRINTNITLPINMVPGAYNLHLWLPDESLRLRNDPRYAVQFANQNVWNSLTGYNLLGAGVVVR